MSFNISSGTMVSKAVKLTTTGATTLITASGRTIVLSVIAAEINGSTPTLTLELNDGTTSYYIRKGKAMVANATEIINETFVLPSGWTLKATAGTANQIDVVATWMSSDAQNRGG